MFATFAAVLALFASLSIQAQPTVLGAKETKFTVNGEPAFLYGISYYGALGASVEFVRADLDEMQRDGFNWIRVWANWGSFSNDVAAVDESGHGREPFLSKLEALVSDCDRRGMIVDVTLSRGIGLNGKPRLPSLEDHERAVETLITTLKSHRNWYLDLSNERNIRDKRFTSLSDLKALREAARKVCPELLVTASHSPDLTPAELQKYLSEAGVDFIAPHRSRDAESPGQTKKQTEDYLSLMKSIGQMAPVHYQEPFRRGYAKGWNPRAEDFVADAQGAYAGGAAGWCFHNGDARGAGAGKPRRSFDLREQRLFEQLDPEELKAINQLREMPFAARKR